MSVGRRWSVGAAVLAVGLVAFTSCGGVPGPDQPTPNSTPSVVSPEPPASPTPASPIPTAGPTMSPTASTGLTLRQLGFDNGPLDEFSVPSDAVISTRVDQPNVVTIILAKPSPQTVEDYLRSTLPAEGFTIDARGGAEAALTFAGNGWTGGFTGTVTTSAIVLRPA